MSRYSNRKKGFSGSVLDLPVLYLYSLHGIKYKIDGDIYDLHMETLSVCGYLKNYVFQGLFILNNEQINCEVW